MGLDEDFEYVGREMRTDFVQGYDNCVSTPDDRGYMLLPAQGLIKSNTDNFYIFLDRISSLSTCIANTEAICTEFGVPRRMKQVLPVFIFRLLTLNHC